MMEARLPNGEQRRLAQSLPKTIPYYLAEQIHRGIVRGKYLPGTSLREQDLGAQFGSSRGPVRESLRLLELQGLVVHSPRRGFRVREYTEEDLESLYHLRALLEGAVIEALEKKDINALVKELEMINDIMRRHADNNDLEAYFEENIRFHQEIIDFTQNSTLIRMLSILNDMSLPVRYLLHCNRFPASNDYVYHKRIIDSLAARRFAEAKRLTMDHILENLPRVKACYQSAVND